MKRLQTTNIVPIAIRFGGRVTLARVGSGRPYAEKRCDKYEADQHERLLHIGYYLISFWLQTDNSIELLDYTTRKEQDIILGYPSC